MAGYIYIPVPTPEMVEFADDWREGQEAKDKVPYEILQNFESGWRKGARRRLRFGVLRHVQATDKVYVLSHGSALGSRFIGARRGATSLKIAGVPRWTGGVMKKYSPDELAEVLRKEGLPKSFVDLRVFACGSGRTPAGVAVSFAHGLAQALTSLGYRSIRVTGYLGSVKTNYHRRQKSRHPQRHTRRTHKGVQIDGDIFPAHTRKVSF